MPASKLIFFKSSRPALYKTMIGYKILIWLLHLLIYEHFGKGFLKLRLSTIGEEPGGVRCKKNTCIANFIYCYAGIV
jgi:hypothetical protein